MDEMRNTINEDGRNGDQVMMEVTAPRHAVQAETHESLPIQTMIDTSVQHEDAVVLQARTPGVVASAGTEEANPVVVEEEKKDIVRISISDQDHRQPSSSTQQNNKVTVKAAVTSTPE